jgi:hypothetical protein
MEFIETLPFSKQAEKLLSEGDFYRLQKTLIENPSQGAVIPGLEGVRKVRIALQGRGKSGGARVIYFFQDSKDTIYLLALYAKNEKGDMSPEDKKWILKEVRIIKKEG